MKEELNISLSIADRSYKLFISPEDEAIFREASKLINDRLKSYSSSYAFKDRQDLLAMVALHYTTGALKSEKILAYRDNGLLEQLMQIDSILDDECQ